MKFLVATLALFSSIVVTAFPDGAPSCQIGAANVRNDHILPTRVPLDTGNNEKPGYITKIDGVPLLVNNDDATFRNNFVSGRNYTLTVEATVPNTYMKGVLLIMSDGVKKIDVDTMLDTRTDRAIFVTDTVNTKESKGCERVPLASIVQTARNQKTVVTMGFTWPRNDQDLFMDVNVVKNNNRTLGSQFYFSQYKLVAKQVVPPSCGLLGLSILCFNGCGFFGRLLGLCSV